MKAILFLTLALVGLDTNGLSANNILPDASERSKTFTSRVTSIIHQNNLIGNSMKQGNNLSHIANDSVVGHFHVSNHHLMLMAGFGTPDATPDFSSLGVGYEYRLPFWNRKFGIGCMAMFMKYENYSHFMPLGTGTLHPYKNWFLQGEIGMAHNKNSEGVHKMATLVGIGAGYHFTIGTIAIAPMLNAEYSRIQRPTYSFLLCISRHNKCH